MNEGTKPHCDPNVLHSPGACHWCDRYAPAAQVQRVKDRVNFTGETKEGLTPCPSDVKRGFGIAEKWEGNLAQVLARATGQIWKIYQLNAPEALPGVVRLGKRHHSDEGWECDNVKNAAVFGINDNHWTDRKRWRTVLMQQLDTGTSQ